VLCYQKVPIEQIMIGDRIKLELHRVKIVGEVVGCDCEQGMLTVTPYCYVLPSRKGSVLRSRPPAMKSFTLRPREGEVRVLKFIHSEAATTPLTWERIAELEPGVLVLLEKVAAERPTKRNFIRIWLKYVEQLSALVGWGREAATYSELLSSAAYNVVYDKLLNSLRDPE
jgi:hypothetical protein